MAEDHVSAQEFGRMQGNVEALQGFTESIDKEQKELAKTVVRNHETSMRRMDEDRKEVLAAIQQNGQHTTPCPTAVKSRSRVDDLEDEVREVKTEMKVIKAKGWGIWRTLTVIGLVILGLITVLTFLAEG